MPAKLWYQRLRLDNRGVVAAVFVGWILEYLHLPFTIGLPLAYYVSFNALTMYLDLGVLLLMILYPKRLLDRFSQMLGQLKAKGVMSEAVAGQVLENARNAIHGREEKYVPLVFGALTSAAWIYHEFSKGLYGVLDFPDLQGNVVGIWSFPITVIHETLCATALFILPIVGFSAFIVIWKILRSMVPEYESIKLDFKSRDRVGGLGPMGRLMVEVVLLVMVISTTYAGLGAVYYIITSQFHLAIVVVSILSYAFLLVLIVPPVYAIHRVMVRKKREELDQLTRKIEDLGRPAPPGGRSDASREDLGWLLTMRAEVEKTRTFPLDASSTRKLTMFILAPVLHCIPLLLESYLGRSVSILPIVIVLSIVTQLISRD